MFAAMRVFQRAGLLCAVAGLTLPSGALAATINVPADQPTIAAAVAAAAENDTILVAAGSYPESVTIPAEKTGLTITGADGAKVTGAAGDLLTIQATGVKINTLGFEVPSGASSAIAVAGGATATLTGLAVSSTAPDPLIHVSGGATLAKSFLLRQTGAAGEPAILSDGAGLTIEDTTAVNATGVVARFLTGQNNRISRSTLASTAAEAEQDAVQLIVGNAGARKLVVDSSALIGGPQSAGARVNTVGGAGGDVSELVLRHATITGSAQGIVLDAERPLLATGAGSIKATVDSSIVHGASVAKGAPGLILIPASTVELNFTNTDTPGVAGSNTNEQAVVRESGSSNTADANLFGSGLHLRADAPVIDTGSAPAQDESATDIDGQPRVNGAASDRGADEFHNTPPKAALTASNTNPIQNEPVTFTSTSTDPDFGDAPQGYAWSFGDGQSTTTVTPAVSHAFANVGTYAVKLAVVDKFGAASEVAELAVTVKDGLPPEIRIVTPKAKSKLRLNPKKRKGARKRPRPRPLTVLGTMRDATGVASVEVAITRKKGKKCHQYTGRAQRRAACDQFTWVPARLIGDSWQYTTRRRLRLKRGRYHVRARGTDVNGNTSTAFTGSSGTLVRFTVR
jgi:PKD repeat protein